MFGDVETQIWGVLEIRGFVIRGFPFPPKSANCKDPLYINFFGRGWSFSKCLCRQGVGGLPNEGQVGGQKKPKKSVYVVVEC